MGRIFTLLTRIVLGRECLLGVNILALFRRASKTKVLQDVHWAKRYETFYGRNLRILKILLGVCP